LSSEVRAWSGLAHANVAPLLGYCMDPPALVSAVAEGGNLRAFMARSGWDPAIGLRTLVDVATGMAYLHLRRVVHGDLKAANVLVDGRGRAAVSDFGLAKVRQGTTTVGGTEVMLAGTPAFMAPEALRGKAIPASDVWSFGMLCYEVVSRGQYPFAGAPGALAVMFMVCVEGRRPERPGGVDDRVWRMMEACWREDPVERPSFV
ncbi:kinase-like domain-containing protein, partial [Hyaloraphidium curvatum]